MNKRNKFEYLVFCVVMLFLGTTCLTSCSSFVNEVEGICDSVFGNDNEASVGDKTKRYSVGDTVSVNGLKITLKKCEEWQQDNEFLIIDEDRKVIRLFLSIENTSDSDKSVGSWDFTCYSDDFLAKEYIYGDDDIEHVSLSAGKETNGYLYFEVPADAKEFVLEYKTNYWTGEKIIFNFTL